MTRYFYISLSYATFGIIAIDGKVSDAAPIANWMKGKRLEDLRAWLIERKADVKEIFV